MQIRISHKQSTNFMYCFTENKHYKKEQHLASIKADDAYYSSGGRKPMLDPDSFIIEFARILREDYGWHVRVVWNEKHIS